MRGVAAFVVSLVITASAFGQQQIVVTNTNDSGSGSLRAAIEEANAVFGAVVIRFAIRGAGPTWTIRPLTPLPRVVGSVTIDGDSQRVFARDSNPAGPEIELDGSALASGNALEICSGVVRGLTINGFPGHAIHTVDTGCRFPFGGGTLSGNYLGTDPTGSRAIPNGRGIWIDDRRTRHAEYLWTVSDSIISGNRHSGVFVHAGATLIKGNIIGLNAARDADLGNGASGVAIMPAGTGSDVVDNYIAFNRHFGVALMRGTRSVAFTANSFQANHQLAIDWGLDGVSPIVDYASPFEELDVPVITSARYENGVTILEATAVRDVYLPQVSFYANDAPDPSGFGEGQHYLGIVVTPTDGRYVFRHAGDLRGKWVTATKTVFGYYGLLSRRRPAPDYDYQLHSRTTSEFSRAVEVK